MDGRANGRTHRRRNLPITNRLIPHILDSSCLIYIKYIGRGGGGVVVAAYYPIFFSIIGAEGGGDAAG